MHEDYDDYEDDDNYENQDKYKHYFKFDPEAWDAWGKLLYETLGDIVESSPNVWYIGSYLPDKFVPVNSYIPNTGQGKSFQYLGSNYAGQGVWKTKYFIVDPIDISYRKHLEANAKHFLQQPIYYRGLFDILN